MSQVVPQFLNDLPLLRELTEDEVERLSRFAARKMLTREAVVQPAGEPVGFIGFVLSGRGQEVLLREDGRALVTRRLRGGAVFGQRALVTSEACPVAVTCAAGTELLLIALTAFQELLPMSVRLLRGLLGSLAERETDLFRRMRVLMIPGGDERVAAYLELVASENPGLTEPTAKSLGLTHEQISLDCGLSRETVSRIMSRLRSEGRWH